MAKVRHEVRDPIHVFVRFSSEERRVIDSRPFQRLRNVHQLALSYLVYPGASHKRFEHSLGVMELAGRVYDVVTASDTLHPQIRDRFAELLDEGARRYWRTAVRMAALCHDIGHLPFSHAAEDLLPPGWSHERLSRALILSPEMREIWEKMTPPLRADDLVKLAVGPSKAKDLSFSSWEALFSEIIVGDGFGVDRIDYLLRDSLHTGVAYGRFDHYRLIDTLRILPAPPTGAEEVEAEPALGIDNGGVHSAEALLWARHFMYSQVYFHPVRLIYNIHLQDFLKAWLPGGKFPIDVDRHLAITDNEVLSAMREAAEDPSKAGHDPARRILKREHFRVLYQRHPEDARLDPDAGEAVFAAASREFGEENVRREKKKPSSQPLDFPVLFPDGRVASSLSVSETLRALPAISIEYIFIRPDLRDRAMKWLESNRPKIITPRSETSE